MSIRLKFFRLFAREAACIEFKSSWNWIGGNECLVDNNQMGESGMRRADP